MKLRGDRILSGTLHVSRLHSLLIAPADSPQAYDAHMNLVMSQVEESIHLVDVSEDGQSLPPRVGRLVFVT